MLSVGDLKERYGRTPPPGPIFIQFRAGFGKNGQINRFAPPLGLAPGEILDPPLVVSYVLELHKHTFSTNGSRIQTN